MRSLYALPILLGACGQPVPGDLACPDYPADATEPMAVGSPIWPYSWPVAEHRDGRQASLDLGAAPCNADDDIEWSPFDVLLFVSIPAW